MPRWIVYINELGRMGYGRLQTLILKELVTAASMKVEKQHEK